MKFPKRHSCFVLVLCFVVLAALFVTCGRVWAVWGARVVHYSQTDIIPIRAKIRFSTLIVLPANEEILDFTTGDKDFWIINGVHNLCYVHPAQAGIKSNLNLITASGHIYSFLLTEISNQPDEEPDLKVFVILKDESSIATVGGQVRYVRASEVEAYKQEAEAAQVQAAEVIQQAQAQAKQQITAYREQYPARLEFDYQYKAKARRPPFSVTAIYHDDKFTYIKSNAQEKPAIYELKDGKPDFGEFRFRERRLRHPGDSGQGVSGNRQAKGQLQAPPAAGRQLVMSAEKWESVTWDWIEREIVDSLLVSNRKQRTSQSLVCLLVKRPAAATVPRKDAERQLRSSNNG